MKSFLQIENLTKSFGDRVLFSDVTFGIYEGDKIGLIAKNGSGKTTLLRIIAGEESYDSGSLVFRNDLRVGYLKQLPELDPNLSVIEACLSIDDEPTAAIRTYERALASGDADALAKAMSQMDAAGAWDYEDRIRQTLTQLKIIDMNQPVGQLSGGQVKRVALAKVVINEPELLILDEPTNHLDIDMIEWLESYLQRSRMSLLMVTHDRYFLDKVCSKIVEIDSRQVYAYNGNYDYYLEKREERLSAQSAELAKVKNLLRTEPDLQIDSNHMMVISPDEGGMGRAIYIANVLGLDMGMFYKRRDYTRVVNGRNPIVAHEFLGTSVEGKDMIIIDDMISSGESVLEVASALKQRGARKIFICTTFGLFTSGMEKFDKAYACGNINRVLTTNLIYQPEELLKREWYVNCDMSKYVAYLIDTLNHDTSISDLLDPNDKIQAAVAKYKKGLALDNDD